MHIPRHTMNSNFRNKFLPKLYWTTSLMALTRFRRNPTTQNDCELKDKQAQYVIRKA